MNVATSEARAPALSLAQVVGRGRLRASVVLFGPAFVAAVAYVDPGNFSTNFIAGSRYGYRLLWVVVLANLMAMPVQYLSAKVGIVTGRSLPEVCRERCRPALRLLLWLQAEIVAIATDLAEFVGAAIGLNLLFGVPPLTAGLITAVAAFVVLGMQSRGARSFERAIFLLLMIVTGGFAYQLAHLGAPDPSIATSLLPRFSGAGSVYLSAGIVGATLMPHVVYLHSALTSGRVETADDSQRRRYLRFERWDVVVALGAAGLINLTMLVVAARVFHHPGVHVTSLAEIHRGLGASLGGGAALAFAIALLASGVSSSSVGTFAGQVVMAGFLHRGIPLYLRRAITMAPALVVLALGVNTTSVLTFSQVLLSFGIPFALIPLLLVTSSRAIMRDFVNSRRMILGGGIIVLVVVALNLALLWSQFSG